MSVAFANLIIFGLLTLSCLNSWAQFPFTPQNQVTAAQVQAAAPSVLAPVRPLEVDADFTEQDFTAKPWMKEFQYVIVVNKADSGAEKQSIRVYKNQKLVTLDDIVADLSQLTMKDSMELSQLQQAMVTSSDSDVSDAIKKLQSKMTEREVRVRELATKMVTDGAFKVSTGRDQFEKKGEHHSQHDSWTITSTGFYTPQYLDVKHKSESYSSSMCDSFLAKLVSVFTKKEMCTFMENAVFFNGGIALHKAIPGTESALGEKASGGCVRLPAALAEFLFHNIDESKATLPQVNVDGTLKLDDQGHAIYSNKSHSVWGDLDSRSALIIVMSKVR